MQISLYAINALTPYIFGKDGVAKNRTSKQLVNLFNKFGCRDVLIDGKLPKIDPKKEFNTTKTEYTQNRLEKLLGTNELRELLVFVLNDQEDIDLQESFNEILIPEKFEVVEVNGQKSILGGVIKKKEEIKNEAAFNDIQNKILNALDGARVSILLAMAWFTNDILRNKLKEKLEEGLRIEIVIYDDGVNKKHGVDLSGFDVVKIKGQRGGIMHNKFCVIDNQVVLHGSYNWSNNAEFRNDETIEISQDNKLASDFSVQFRILKNSIK